MQCYSELVPPTVVKHAISLPFTSSQSENLVIAKGSLLQVFSTTTISAESDAFQTQNQSGQSLQAPSAYDRRLNDDDGLESSFLGVDNVLIRSDRNMNTKLVLVAEYPVYGDIQGLARVKIQNSKSGGEAILIHTRDVRLSLVQWDPEEHAIEDISIHYYEKKQWEGSATDGPLRFHSTLLAADPQSRCVALKFGLRRIAFLPFRQSDEDIDMDAWDKGGDQAAATDKDFPVSSNAPMPYTSSFVLALPQLDPFVLHPIHLAFLHDYREPTFGILSSQGRRSKVRRLGDHITYKVFTIDLYQKASTTILSVENLPQTLFRVVPLRQPVGGALLIGSNELIHIDQSGKANGVGVNSFSKEMTGFPLSDQYELELRLENCVIEPMSLDTSDLLMALDDGRIAIVSFKIDGRTVSGVSVKLVPADNGGDILSPGIRCMARVGKNCVFAGSVQGDSMVLGWTRKHTQATKKRVGLIEGALDSDFEDEDLEDDDDIYGEGISVAQPTANNGVSKGGDLNFRVHDSLLSLCPITDMAVGKGRVYSSDQESTNVNIAADLHLTCTVGRGKASSLAHLNQSIQPKVIGRFDFSEARGLWTMSVQKPIPKSLQGDKGDNLIVGAGYEAVSPYDKFMIASKVDLDGYETSGLYALTGAGIEAVEEPEFDPAAGLTIEAGTMGNNMRIIQVLKFEVRCYDGDLGLTQILPMADDETDSGPRVVSASIVDPYLLLVREDSSLLIAQITHHNELEEMDKDDQTLTSTKWLKGCLYKDDNGAFNSIRGNQGTSGPGTVYMFLLSATGTLFIYALPDLSKPIYTAAGLSLIPHLVFANESVQRGLRGSRQEEIVELLVADLGDSITSKPYMILRHANNDVTIYEPFSFPSTKKSSADSTSDALCFRKISNSRLAVSSDQGTDEDASLPQERFSPLRRCPNIGGYNTVFLPGPSPSFIIKSSKTSPQVVKLQSADGSGIRGFSPFHTDGCDHGFIYADTLGLGRVAELSSDVNITELGLSVRKIPLNQAVTHVSYNIPTDCYAVACSAPVPFELPKDDEYHREWTKEKAKLLPTGEQGSVKLISPINWTFIDTFELEPGEVVMCLKTLRLEVSEETKERRMVIAVGTAINRGEDLPIRGRILVLDVVSVIPQPNRPETNLKLKLIAHEDVPRGPVTALCEIGTQGLMLVAQGQKCMVRGLKEDGTLLPVAFMDMSCYVTAVQEIRGTGLCVMADAFMGVWFVGYSEEPYRMTLFGKSSSKMGCLTTDFLLDGPNMSIVVCDNEGVLHSLYFDPDTPQSVQGQQLLNRASFSVTPNHVTTTLNLPRLRSSSSSSSSSSSTEDQDSTSQILLLASPSGALASLTPVSEPEYRRLTSLCSFIANALPHIGGTNPKGHRIPPQDDAYPAPAVDVSAGRSMVDGTLLARWNELSTRRRGEAASKSGYGTAVAVRAGLEKVMGWSGVEYF